MHDREGAFRRVLVPIDSFGLSGDALALAARMGRSVCGPLRLVYVRVWDPPLPRGAVRFYPQSTLEATAALDRALTLVWACGVEASGVVVDAERSETAAAILAEASTWDADVIVLTHRPRRIISLSLWDKVARQVMREADRPILIVSPSRM
jgi:nucleotide-binding universal stress UspA family protein